MGVQGLVEFKIEVETGLAQKRVKPFARSRRDEEAGVLAHLVKVGGDIGAPVLGRADKCPRFGLGDRQPLAVDVEPVMVGAAPGPFVIVLAMLRIGHGDIGVMHVRPLGEPVGAIGVDHHDLVDDGLVQKRLDLGALRRGQVIENERRGIIARGFRAVHAVGELDNDRLIFRDLSVGLAQGELGLSDLFKPSLVGGRGDGDAQDGTAEMTAADGLYANAVRRGGDGLYVGRMHFRRENDLAALIPQNRFGCRDRRIIAGVKIQQVRNRFGRVVRLEIGRCGASRGQGQGQR